MTQVILARYRLALQQYHREHVCATAAAVYANVCLADAGGKLSDSLLQVAGMQQQGKVRSLDPRPGTTGG